MKRNAWIERTIAPVVPNARQAARLAERPAPIADGWRAVQAASLATYRRELDRERVACSKRLARLAAMPKPARKPRRNRTTVFLAQRPLRPGQFLAIGWRVPLPAEPAPTVKSPGG